MMLPSNIPYLPSEILLYIAKIDIGSWRRMLAIPFIGRYSLDEQHQKAIQNHFSVIGYLPINFKRSLK